MIADEITKKGAILRLGICVSLVQVACYYLISATIRADGTFAIAQPDTLLYCQAARRIAEGFPFSFSSGTAVCTGTTSVLYPFILAFLYWVGFKGSLLLTAGFVVNAVFYVLFTAGWILVACKVFEERPFSRLVSALLVALFGPFAYCALAQSDTGLWMAASAWLAYGLVSGTRRIYAPLLVMAPWIRPEGMILVLSFFAICGVWTLRRRITKTDVILSIVSVISVSAVFGLNYALTGEFQFSSVAHKGHFKNLSLFPAVYVSALDFMRIVKSYLLGIPQAVPRDFFYLPVAGAVFMWIGFFTRSWRCLSWRELAWYLAMLGGIVTVAMSSWQNTNLDRYLVWLMPTFLLYMALGAEVVSSWLKPGVARVFPGGILVVFTFSMAIVVMFLFGFSSRRVDLVRNFAMKCDVEMPQGASFGSWGNCGIVYDMSERRVVHLSGIYSPEMFKARTVPSRFEILKNEARTRFDYWICHSSDKSSYYCDKPDIVVGPEVLVSPPDLELRKADWSAYDAALSTPCVPVKGVSLKARVDVAYEHDEKTVEYEPLTRDDYPFFSPFLRAGVLKGTNVVEAGRFLLGGDAMTLAFDVGRDVHVIMRTTLKCTVPVDRELAYQQSEVSLKSPMRLNVFVDDVDAGTIEFKVDSGDFCDVYFMIPGKVITHSPCRLSFHGDHVAFCYWFYQ